MSSTFPFFVFIPAALVGFAIFTIFLRYRRLSFINGYQWPPGLIDRLKAEHPQLSAADIARIDKGLRQFFRAYLNGGRRPVAMPSKVVDDLWHEFILYTRDYQRFCRKAFGCFLHHTPVAVLAKGQKASNEGLRRVWWQSCKEEGINPVAPATLPVLFALDGTLRITGGYEYAANCAELRRQGVLGAQCGTEFSVTHYDGGTDGMGDGGSGDGGGDGGGGCGGD